MESRITLQPAYLLHRIPFQNSSLIVDLFTRDYGRVRAVAKGARGAKSRSRALLQPFQPLLVSLTGRSELKTLTGVEAMHQPLRLDSTRLFSGLYVNELLSRLLPNHTEHEALYGFYQDTLVALQGDSPLDHTLRYFELSLLAQLGYGISFEVLGDPPQSLESSSYYLFDPKQGFSPCSACEDAFLGAEVIALRDGSLENLSGARAAKRLLRLALADHLGSKPLSSRSLFGKPRHSGSPQ